MDIVHKSHLSRMAVCVAAAFAGCAALAAKPAITVSASLADGSTVRGEFLTEKIAGATLFEKSLALAPSLVRTLSFTGTNMAGEFPKGVDGFSLHVPPYTSAARFELKPGTVGRKGTIEFWGKIDEGMARLTTGGCPRFFEIICYEPRDEISQDWNSNNGTGGAGLTFRLGGLPVMASSSYGRFSTYDFIKEDLYGWHHYALVWDADGITLDNGGTATAAVFVDGKSVMTTSAANWNGPPLANHRSFLVFPSREDEMPSYGRVGYAIDEFKIWNYAKTDFQ